MFIWNRTELLVTLSLEYYLRVQSILQQNQIKVQTRIVKRPQLRFVYHAGEMTRRQPNQYYVYVHKDDLEHARELLQTIGPEKSA